METYKIYIFGIVALALALAALSLHLLSDKKKKKVAQVKLLTLVYVYVFFFMIVLMLLIMIEFYRGPEIKLMNNDDYQLVIKEHVNEYEASDVNDEDGVLYKDPTNNFYILNPKAAEWGGKSGIGNR